VLTSTAALLPALHLRLGHRPPFCHNFPGRAVVIPRSPFTASEANSRGWWAKHRTCLLLAWLTQIFPFSTFFCPSSTIPVLFLLVPVPSWSPAPSAQRPPLNYGPFEKKRGGCKSPVLEQVSFEDMTRKKKRIYEDSCSHLNTFSQLNSIPPHPRLSVSFRATHIQQREWHCTHL